MSKHLTIQKVRREDRRIYTEICNTPYSDFNILDALKYIQKHCSCKGWYRKIRKDNYDIILSGDHVDKAKSWGAFSKLECTVLPETVFFSQFKKKPKQEQLSDEELGEFDLEFDNQDGVFSTV